MTTLQRIGGVAVALAAWVVLSAFLIPVHIGSLTVGARARRDGAVGTP